MNDSSHLLVTARIRKGMDKEFAAWKARHDQVIAKSPGYIGSDIIPPAEGNNQWTIILNFRSPEDLEKWKSSGERESLIKEASSFLEDGALTETVQNEGVGQKADSSVTEVIFSKVKHGMEETYQEWATRIQAAQAMYPGYRGTFLQPPDQPGGLWTTIMRYGSAAQLEAWMKSPERKALLAESKAFIEHEQLTRLATSFPGWVPIDPATGEGPPNWKTSLLVLLGLFPIVMLEMKFLSPILTMLGLHASLATFIGNTISVFLTSFGTMPLFIRWFGWWLFPKPDLTSTSVKGCIILAVLFALEIIILWRLLPW